MGCGVSSETVVVGKDAMDEEQLKLTRVLQARVIGRKKIAALRLKYNQAFMMLAEGATKALGPLDGSWACGEFVSNNSSPHFIPSAGPTDLSQRVPRTDSSLAGSLIFRFLDDGLTGDGLTGASSGIPRMVKRNVIIEHHGVGGAPHEALVRSIRTKPTDAVATRAMMGGCLSSYSCGFIRVPKEPITLVKSAAQMRKVSVGGVGDVNLPQMPNKETATSREGGDYQEEVLVAANGDANPAGGGVRLMETRGYISSRKPIFDTSIDGELISPVGGLFVPSSPLEETDTTDLLEGCTEEEVNAVLLAEQQRLQSRHTTPIPRPLEKYFLFPKHISAMGIKLNYRVIRTVCGDTNHVDRTVLSEPIFNEVTRSLLERGVLPKEGFNIPLTTFFRNASHVVEQQSWRSNFRLQPNSKGINRNSSSFDEPCLPDCFVTFHAPAGRCTDRSMFSEAFARTETSIALRHGIPLNVMLGQWWGTLQDCVAEDEPIRIKSVNILRALYDSGDLFADDDLYWLALRRQLNIWIIAVMCSAATQEAASTDVRVYDTSIELRLGLLPAHPNDAFIAYNGFGNNNTVARDEGSELFNASFLPPLREYHDSTRPHQSVPFHGPVSEGTFTVDIRHLNVSTPSQMAPYLSHTYKEVRLLDVLFGDILGHVFTTF